MKVYQILAFSLDDGTKTNSGLGGIFIINENLKTRINGPYYLIIMFG